ncbi:MAG: acetyl-CoA C-acetyltransferase [Pseudomonadales bacterium]|jgi:acetyl-CoA C-acetyltransferase
MEAYIYDAIRTPRGIGKAKGSLHEVKPVTLVAELLNHLQNRNGFATNTVDDVVLGCVSAVGDQGANIAKSATLLAGWDDDVAGVTLNRFCASGLEAVNIAAMKVKSGWEDLVVAGGVESMSRVKMGSDGGAWALDPETNLKTGFAPQGIGADLIATLGGYTREAVDAFAVQSHQRAHNAWERGAFNKSVIPVTDRNGVTVLARDELIRPEASMESLAALKSSFAGMGEMGFDRIARARYPQVEHVEHVHTPGNASGIVDGAALVLVGSAAAGEQMGIKPRARIVSTALVGTEPTIMLTGPSPAANKALAKAGMNVEQIDLFEVNEAFASVVMRFMDEQQISPDKVNVNGGAIAMGHPLGATGAMILGSLIDELEARDLRFGMATLCAGGGIGIATIVERL